MGQLKVWNPVTSAYEAVTAAGVTVRDASGAQQEANAGTLVYPDGTVFPQGDGSVVVREVPTGVVGASVYHNTTQSVTVATPAALAHNAVEWDTDGFWSSGANTRLTVPAGMGGRYVVFAQTHVFITAAHLRTIQYIYKNGAAVFNWEVDDTADAYQSMPMSFPLTLAAGDYVEHFVLSPGGSGSDAYGHASSVTHQSRMALYKLGAGNVSGLGTARAVRTSGSLTLNSTTWANVDTGLDLVVPVQAGDVLLVTASMVWGAEVILGYLDAATVVSGSPVNYVSGGAGGATSQGVTGWRGHALAGLNENAGTAIQYVVQSGDISGGNVTLRLRYRTGTAAAKTLYGTTDIPLHWSVVNLRGGAASRDIGYEFVYTEFTAPVNVTATTEATANSVVAAPAVVFDGNTAVMVECFLPYAYPQPTESAALFFVLYDGTSIGKLGLIKAATATPDYDPQRLVRKLTPTAGSHTYSIRCYVDTGTGVVGAGAGGLGNYVPGYIRITKA